MSYVDLFIFVIGSVVIIMAAGKCLIDYWFYRKEYLIRRLMGSHKGEEGNGTSS